MSNPSRLESIFFSALGKQSSAERVAFLDEACAGDDQLRRSVERMLAAQAEAGSFLERPAPSPDFTSDATTRERPGTIIGPYKLLQQIGEGGMGTVFMAEQTKPVDRQVALKIIKPGMDSNKVIARFEAERQALALMDHPNIAKVLDAGTTDAGRPYFVMELVKGVPITEYCDKNHLTVRQRLELLLPVCQAVQHAHQKGIIHRDIKPSNVMVALYDGRPVPKVIDFGVAKATGSRLTDKTVFTEFGQVVGTLEYMSPEQAELNQLDVDTRSDIYSLGVLLYELLTGTTPLERKRLQSAAFDEMLRIIREEEPPTPSTRLSTTNELASIAANRGLEPKRLSGLVRGELDWIVMKTLEKDRSRRYETTNGLAMDISRYLADEAVQAGPPSATYRFRKFARRNRVAITTATLVALALGMGTIISTWQAVRATRAEHTAESARADEVQQRKIAEAALVAEAEQRKVAETERAAAEANLQKAQAAVDEYFTTVSQSKLLDKPGMEPLRKELLESAVRYYQTFVDEHADDPALKSELAAAHVRLGHIYDQMGSTQWIDELVRVTEIVEPLVDQRVDVSQWKSLREGIWFTDYRGSENVSQDGPRAVLACNRAIPVWEKLVKQNPDVPGFTCDLAALHFTRATRLPRSDARSSYEQAVANWERFASHTTGTPRQLMFGIALRNLAELCRDDRDWEDSYKYASRAVQVLTASDQPFTAGSLTEIFPAFSVFWEAAAALNRREEASKVFRKIASSDASSATTHYARACAFELLNEPVNVAAEFARAIEVEPSNADLYKARAQWHVLKGRHAEAIADFDKAIELRADAGLFRLRSVIFEKIGESAKALADLTRAIELEPKDPYAYTRRADFYRRQGRYQEALADFSKGIELDEPSASLLYNNRAFIYRSLGDFEAALADFSKAIELAPSGMLYHYNHSMQLKEMGESAKALAGFTRAIDLNPKYPDAYKWRADFYRHEGRYQEAIADYSKRIELGEPSADVFNSRCTAYGLIGDDAAALADIAKAIELDPKNAVYHFNHAMSLKTLYRRQEALDEIKSALELAPKDWQAHYLRCRILGEMLRTDEALEEINGAIQRTPKQSGLWHARSVIYARLGKDQEALADMDSAVQHAAGGEESCEMHVRRGRLKRRMGMNAEAETDFKLASEREDGGPWLAHAKGELGRYEEALEHAPAINELRIKLRLAMKDYQGALDELAAAENEFPERGILHSLHGLVLAELARYEEAVRELSRAIELAPYRVEDWRRRGWVAAVQGRYDDASSDFEEAVKIDEFDPLALRRLAWFLATCPDEKYRDATRAVTLAEKAASTKPHDGLFWYTLGICQYRAGKYDEAQKACQRGLDMRDQPYSPLEEPRFATDYDHDAGFFLAMSQWQLGDKAKARETFDAAVAWTKDHAPDDEQLARFQKEAGELLGVEMRPPEKQD